MDKEPVDATFQVVDYKPPIPWGRIVFHTIWTGWIAYCSTFVPDIPAAAWVFIAAAQWPMASISRSLRSPPLPEWQVAQLRQAAEERWRRRPPSVPAMRE